VQQRTLPRKIVVIEASASVDDDRTITSLWFDTSPTTTGVQCAKAPAQALSRRWMTKFEPLAYSILTYCFFVWSHLDVIKRDGRVGDWKGWAQAIVAGSGLDQSYELTWMKIALIH
jgi:hypothetical protein